MSERVLTPQEYEKIIDGLNKVISDNQTILMQQGAQCMAFMRIIWIILRERKRDIVISDEEMESVPQGFLVEFSGDKVAGKPALRVHASTTPDTCAGKN